MAGIRDVWVEKRLMPRHGVAWYKFSEGSGAILGDSKGNYSGNIFNCTWNNEESSLKFTNSTTYIDFPDKVIPIGKKSIRLKVKTTMTGAGIIVHNCERGTASHGTIVGVIDGKMYFTSVYGSSGSYRFDLLGNKLINDGQWHDILCTWDGTTDINQVKVYVDDMSVPDVVGTAKSLDTIPTRNMRMGVFYGGNNPFSGEVRLMEIYDEVIQPFANTLLIKSNNIIYVLENGVFVDRTGLFSDINNITEQEFMEYGTDSQVISASAINSLNALDSFEVMYYTDDTSVSAPTINITGTPKPQLVLPKGDIQLPMLDKINNLIMYSNRVGGGDVKIVFSVDSGLTWKTYNSTTLAFEDVDISNIANVKNSGMTADIFNSIGTKWNEVVLDSKIRFAYYLEIADLSDIAEVDKLDVNIDMIGRWKKAVHGTDYDYEYDNTKLYVSLLTDGNYKINYQE